MPLRRITAVDTDDEEAPVFGVTYYVSGMMEPFQLSRKKIQV
jgi:hypothetical protein